MPLDIITCPVCGASEPTMRDGDAALTLAEIGEFRCDACAARVVFGSVLPHVVVEPTRGARGLMWIRCRVQDPKTRADLYVLDVDPKMAVELARNFLSLVRI